jgi:hypothetical protein
LQNIKKECGFNSMFVNHWRLSSVSPFYTNCSMKCAMRNFIVTMVNAVADFTLGALDRAPIGTQQKNSSF